MTEQPGPSDRVVFDSGSSAMAIYADRIVIANRGLSSLGAGGRVTLMLDSIRAIDFREASWFSRGHLAFVSSEWRGTDEDAATILFAKKSQSVWEEARRVIQSRLDAGPRVGPASQGSDVMDQLQKLGELRDAGIITQQEFETQKGKLLAKL